MRVSLRFLALDGTVDVAGWKTSPVSRLPSRLSTPAERELASQGVAHLKLSAANDVQGAMYSKDALLSELNLLELGLLASLSSAVPS